MFGFQEGNMSGTGLWSTAVFLEREARKQRDLKRQEGMRERNRDTAAS